MSTRILAMAVLALGMSPGEAAEISWAKDWAAAQSSAKTQKKPLMVDFYTDWCGWCKKLDEAIGLFRKADTAEARAADRSYAKISIVQCYLVKQDQEAAAKEAKALIDLKDAVPEHVRAARDFLKKLDG